jgi:hypothetical protein
MRKRAATLVTLVPLSGCDNAGKPTTNAVRPLSVPVPTQHGVSSAGLSARCQKDTPGRKSMTGSPPTSRALRHRSLPTAISSAACRLCVSTPCRSTQPRPRSSIPRSATARACLCGHGARHRGGDQAALVPGRGVTFAQTLRREPWGAKTFIVKDPDGNLLLFAGPAE